ncbi:MAG: glycoside hydrolase family 32 protein, partial [Pseudobutyrivibrio sp.]|nr:glycoside hydrolase family 32 protein [Pseudobutyrivibrio sp.]
MYINIPVKVGKEEKFLEIWDKEEKLFEFKIPCASDAQGFCADYFASVPLGNAEVDDLRFKGDFCNEFFEGITYTKEPASNSTKRPRFHFTPEYGWINDPNGLVYDGEKYHLYYQYNPFNLQWANMLWGHAASSDLINWQHQDAVMFPDENGMMFSGCGLKNENALLGYDKNALLFFYTSAGDSTPWSKDVPFAQRLAVSTDGGATLNKLKAPVISGLGKDSRDPMVFWHENSRAYVMVLYLENNDFGILRSEDLMDWKLTQRFTLKDAWECPNLLSFDVAGRTVWLLLTADGFYYFGEFDGFCFS